MNHNTFKEKIEDRNLLILRYNLLRKDLFFHRSSIKHIHDKLFISCNYNRYKSDDELKIVRTSKKYLKIKRKISSIKDEMKIISLKLKEIKKIHKEYSRFLIEKQNKKRLNFKND